MDDRSFGNSSTDEGSGLAFRIKNGWHRITAPFTDDDDYFSFPILIAGISAVAAVFFLVCWFYITAKITAIYLGDFTVAANDTALHFLSHRLAQLVQQDERGLVGKAQIAAEGQGALALHLVAEHGNGRQIAAQGQFVRSEQRPAGNGEVLLAALAAEAERTIRAPGFVGIDRTAGRANRGAVRIGPTDILEGCFGFRVSHAEDLSEAQGLCRSAEEEVLGHGSSRF